MEVRPKSVLNNFLTMNRHTTLTSLPYHSMLRPNGSDRDFDHRTPEHLDGSGLSAKAEYDEVGSSDINILTPESSTDIPVAHRRLPSYHSEAKRGPGLCPHWKVHSTERNLWKGCQMCKSHLRKMFADLVLDGL
jgi:hypothetical protein